MELQTIRGVVILKNALESVKEFAKEYKVDGNKALPLAGQINFARTQEQEQKTVINRLLVDLARAQRNLDSAKDEPTREAYAEQVSKFRKDLRQLTETLDFFQELVKGLEAEQPAQPSVQALQPEA